MSTAPNNLVFFLVVFFFFSASKALKEHKQQNDTGPTFQVINGMAKNSEAVRVGCWSGARSLDAPTLGYGESHVWKVEFEKQLYSCTAEWGPNSFTDWNAYQPKRDNGHGAVFWLVNEKGIFFSRDKTSWVRKATWQTD